MRSRVDGLIRWDLPFSRLDTLLVETPDRRATSVIVAFAMEYRNRIYGWCIDTLLECLVPVNGARHENTCIADWVE